MVPRNTCSTWPTIQPGRWALRSTLSAHYEDRPFTLIFGAMRDKAIGEIAEILFPLAERVIVTHADNPRSATAAGDSPGGLAACGTSKKLRHSRARSN